MYPDEAKQMEGYTENIGVLLKRELGIDSITTIDRNTENARNYNLDVVGITDYIENKCGWRRNVTLPALSTVVGNSGWEGLQG